MKPEAEIFLKSVRTICPDLTDIELNQFASTFSFERMKKRALFLQSGKVQTVIGFITKGLVRSFFTDRDGNEITVGFYSEGDYAAHYPSFISQQPSRYSIQCLEPTTMVCLSFEGIQWIYQQAPGFERYGRLAVQEIFKRQQARIESFIFQTAEERYLDFIDHHPTLFGRISLSHLCSFLGIERQSLSRIRRKLSHR